MDDKIELNRRINDNLEQQAQAIFKSWFVDGASNEWELMPLSFYGDIVCGKTPSKSVSGYFGGDIPFIKIPDMHGNIFVFVAEDSLTKSGQESQKNKTLPPKSILVSCIATVGLVIMNAFESQCNQQINAIIPRCDFYRYFLFLQMKSMYEELHILAGGGTATLNLNTGNFAKIELPYPRESILTNFNTVISPLFDKIYENQAETVTLIQLRDTLLPKLMSGELSVSEAETEV